MKENFFNIRYVFGKDNIWNEIDKVVDERGKGYIVVADGVVVNTAQFYRFLACSVWLNKRYSIAI